MALTDSQITELKDAAKRLDIVGKFSSGPAEAHVFNGKNQTRQSFFDSVKPGLGRVYSEITVGGQPFKTILLVPPLHADETQALQADSPLFEKEGGAWDEIGKAQFTRLVSLVDQVMQFQHPQFSADLVDLAIQYISNAVGGGHLLGSSWNLIKRDPVLAAGLCQYLMAPSSDEVAVLESWTNKLGRQKQFLGKVPVETVRDKLEKLRAALTSDKSGDATLASVTGPHGSAKRLASYASGYLNLPTGCHFAAAYRIFRKNSDELHARLRSPELFSFIVWWWVHGYDPEMLHEEGDIAGENVRSAFEIGIAAKGLDRKRGLSFEQRKAQAEAAQKTRGEAMSGIKDEDKELYGRLLDQLFEVFDRSWDVARPLERSDMERQVTGLFETLAVMGMPWFKTLKAAVNESAEKLRGADQIILNQPQDMASALQEWAKNNSQQELIASYLSKLKAEGITPGHDSFYEFATRQSIVDKFSAARINASPDTLKKRSRIRKFMRFLLQAQGGLGSETATGLPMLVHLPQEAAAQLDVLLQESKSHKKTQAPGKTTLRLRGNAANSVRGVPSGKVVLSSDAVSAQFHAPDAAGGDFAAPSEEFTVVDLEVAGELLALPDDEDLLGRPVQVGGQSYSVRELLDADAEAVVLGTLAQQRVDLSPLPDAITNQDLAEWDTILAEIHAGFPGDESQTYKRLYRAATLGRYLLAASDKDVPFGRKDLSNSLGLIVELVSRFGRVEGSGAKAQLKDISAEERATLNLSTTFPVSTRDELADMVRGHREIIWGIKLLRGYLEEVDSIATIIHKSHGTGIEIVVINATLDKLRTEFLGYPSRQLYVTSQARDLASVSTFLPELDRTARAPGDAMRVQFPVSLGAGHAPEEAFFNLPAFANRGNLVRLALAVACCDGAQAYPALLGEKESRYSDSSEDLQGQLQNFQFNQDLPLVKAFRQLLDRAEPAGSRSFDKLKADLLFSRMLTVAVMSANAKGAQAKGAFLNVVEHVCVLVDDTESSVAVHPGFAASLAGIAKNPGLAKGSKRGGLLPDDAAKKLSVVENHPTTGLGDQIWKIENMLQVVHSLLKDLIN